MDGRDWVAYGSFHPSYARVVGWAIDEPHGFALVDTNDDGREIAFELFARDGDGWRVFDGMDDVSLRGRAGWSSAGVVYGYGIGLPGGTVHVEHHGTRHEITVNDTGWWAFIRHVDNPGEKDVPRRV